MLSACIHLFTFTAGFYIGSAKAFLMHKLVSENEEYLSVMLQPSAAKISSYTI